MLTQTTVKLQPFIEVFYITFVINFFSYKHYISVYNIYNIW